MRSSVAASSGCASVSPTSKNAPFFWKMRFDSGSLASAPDPLSDSASAYETGKSLGELDRRRQALGPRSLAVLLDRHLETAHGAGDARRAPAFDAVSRQLALGIEIHVARRLGRRHLAEIDERRSAIGEPDQHEAAAAQVAREGMRRRHGEAHRDRRVDGVPALLQDRHADIDGLRFHRDRHAVPRAHRLARRIGRDGGGDNQAARAPQRWFFASTHLIESAAEAP